MFGLAVCIIALPFYILEIFKAKNKVERITWLCLTLGVLGLALSYMFTM